MPSCTLCMAEKPLAEFRLRAGRKKPNARCRECESAAERARYWSSPEKARAKSAQSMKRLRSDPGRRPAHLAKRRDYYNAKAKHTERAYYERLRTEQPWQWRVRNLRRNVNPAITVEWLRSLWDQQGGLCALSGRPLEIQTAELDHRIPRSRGGGDDLTNLRLVAPEANRAKGALTDDELVALCRDILGRALLEGRQC